MNNDATGDLEVQEIPSSRDDNTGKYVFKFDYFRESLRGGARAITHPPRTPRAPFQVNVF